jgi:hypothetical protein
MPTIDFSGNSAQGFDNAQRKPVEINTPTNKPGQQGPMSTQGQVQQNVQRMNPFSVNNGNPRGANNMGNYRDTLNQGGKPMPGGYQQQQQQQRPPMPNFSDYGSAGDFASAIRMYNQSTQRDRFDPAYGIIPADSATAEDRQLMGLPGNAYQNQFTPDGRRRFDQMGYGAPGGGFNLTLDQIRGMFNGDGSSSLGMSPSNQRPQSLSFEDWRDTVDGGVRMTTMEPGAAAGADRMQREDYQRWLSQQGGGGQQPPRSNQQQGYWDQGQRGDLGRYVPPMMQDYRNPTSWYFNGGYNYNLPGAAGQFPTQGGFLNPPIPDYRIPRVPYPGG